MTLTDWAIPVLAAAGAIVWAGNLRTSLHRPSSADVRVATLATITVVAAALTVSALVYPGVITAEGSRIANTVARVSLLAGGVAVWWLARRPVEEP